MRSILFLCLVLITVNGDIINPGHVKYTQAPKACTKSEYRSLDGSCNNLKHSTWGMASRPYGSLIGFHYADGRHEFARSLSGKELPEARKIALELFSLKDDADHKYNLVASQYWQIIADDMSLSSQAQRTGTKSTVCCKNGKVIENLKQKDKCAPISVPPDDPVLGPYNISCLDFTRTPTTYDYGYSDPHEIAKPMSAVTSWMDLSIVYGNSQEESDCIRTFECGRLKIENEEQKWPPQQEYITEHYPTAKRKNDLYYKGGNAEINQDHQLISLHEFWLYEHNRLATTLCILNPHWNDEKIYQEARRITIAEYQHITYNEYLPIILGKKYMEKNKLYFPKSEGCVNDYDSDLDPSVANELASVQAHRSFYPAIIGFLQGQNSVGLDFWTVNIQRCRDHGVAPYVKVRRICGLPVPTSFEDLTNICKISSKSVEILKTLYECVEDIDLAVGGALEPLLPGTLTGETFHYILIDFFKKIRCGDRFFYQNCEENKFEPEQLKTIQATTIFRILCFNSEIEHTQENVFEPISKENDLQSCHNHPPFLLHYWCDQESVPLDDSTIDEIQVEAEIEERSKDTDKIYVLRLNAIPLVGIDWI